MIVIHVRSDDPAEPELIGPFDKFEEARRYLTEKGYYKDHHSVGLWRKNDFSLYEKLARIVQVAKPN